MSSGFIDTRNFEARIAAALVAEGSSVRQGLWAAGEHILGVSNEQVPHEEGDLMVSGAVSQDDAGMTAVSYDTPYAVVQHEDLTMKHDSGRNAKYLENAIRSEETVAFLMIRNALKGTMGL